MCLMQQRRHHSSFLPSFPPLGVGNKHCASRFFLFHRTHLIDYQRLSLSPPNFLGAAGAVGRYVCLSVGLAARARPIHHNRLLARPPPPQPQLIFPLPSQLALSQAFSAVMGH